MKPDRRLSFFSRLEMIDIAALAAIFIAIIMAFSHYAPSPDAVRSHSTATVAGGARVARSESDKPRAQAKGATSRVIDGAAARQ